MQAYAIIPLTQGKYAIVDADMVDYLSKWSWRAVRSKHKFYAKTTVTSKHRRYSISMHRLIAKTPSGQVTHHKNGNSLDNRRSNLQNMERSNHELYHANNSLCIKRNPDYALVTPATSGIY